jgi:hypothetical protein
MSALPGRVDVVDLHDLVAVVVDDLDCDLSRVRYREPAALRGVEAGPRVLIDVGSQRAS